jgi:outer membrane protein assembly factor BamC
MWCATLIGQIFDSAYSTPERDKFRTRIERGTAAGTTEIYISHRGMYEIYITEGRDQTRWQPRAPDPDLEAEMLRRLMVRLGAVDSKASTLIAESAQPPRAQIKAAEGSSVLTLQEPFDRAWRRVGLALDRVGFTVEDRDRSQGIYFVRYVDPDSDASKKDEGGFWNSLKFWKGIEKTGAIDATARYRVHVKTEGDTSTIQVLTREGGVDKSETSKRILGLLQEQLK